MQRAKKWAHRALLAALSTLPIASFLTVLRTRFPSLLRYDLQTPDGKNYKAYCDFKVDGGGWQLVASVHEDNIKA